MPSERISSRAHTPLPASRTPANACRDRRARAVLPDFPKSTIDEIKQQKGRDLTRFDLDFYILDQFLPDFPPAIYLTTRPDLGDVSQGKLVTSANYYELFNGILKTYKSIRSHDFIEAFTNVRL